MTLINFILAWQDEGSGAAELDREKEESRPKNAKVTI
jgi:hypothetical protein